MARGDRWLYAFAGAGSATVKIGLVLREDRLVPRLREVQRFTCQADLRQVAASILHGVNHPEAEHIESVVRHWLCGGAGFAHSGLVDWLVVPDPPPEDWQSLLDSAVRAATVFGR